MSTPLQYLDRPMYGLRDLGLVPEKTEEAPIVALLNQISNLDDEKVVAPHHIETVGQQGYRFRTPTRHTGAAPRQPRSWAVKPS